MAFITRAAAPARLLFKQKQAYSSLQVFCRFNSSNGSPKPSETPPKGSHPGGGPGPNTPPGKGNRFLVLVLLGLGSAAGVYFFSTSKVLPTTDSSTFIKGASATSSDYHPQQDLHDKKKLQDKANPAEHPFNDYLKVYNAIAKRLEDESDYDDGSYGPVVVRLAWHSSGTYSKLDHTGGSEGGTIRLSPEANHEANNGLDKARDFLEPIKKQFPWITYADLYTLAGVCAIQQMDGPSIKWRPGRYDLTMQTKTYDTPPDRLPNAALGTKHVHDVFGRMGFNEQETTALVGGHCLGRCHRQNTGFDGPWTFSPITFTNDFYNQLLNDHWHIRKWDGNKQYQDDETNSLMMLPADMAFLTDPKYRKWSEIYAKDSDRFFKDFSTAFSKLLELGVRFKPDSEKWVFPVYESQDD